MLMIFYASAEAFGYLLLAVLTFSVFFIPWVLMRQRKIRPIVVSPESARQRIALIYLIRGAEILVAVPILGGLGLIGIGFFITLNPFHFPSTAGKAYSITMLIALLGVAAWIIAKSIERYRAFGWDGVVRNIWKVDANSVSNFSFFFAAFASHDLYHFLPLSDRHEAPSLLSLFLAREHLWIIAFWLVWYGTKTFLNRVLDLNSPQPPPKEDASDPSAPFVPFDPYDLAKNRPIRPLPES